MSTPALIAGLVVANVVQPGAGMNVDPAGPTPVRSQPFERAQTSVTGLLDIIPNTMVSALTEG